MWVHRFRGGSEDDVDPLGFKHLTILLQCARIATEILIRPELCGIDENRCDDNVAMLACGLNQGTMTCVQRAHGGDKANTAWGWPVAAGTQCAQCRAKP